MRSIWKGHIRFSLVTIPIRIYNAVDTEETIRFQQLHKEDNGPVGYEKKCKKCGKTLTAEEIVKGYEFEPEQYVIVSADDFAKIKLQSTKVIEIEGFIDATEVHPPLFDAPYLAGPDGVVAAKTYSLLSQALKASGKVGIGKVVLSGYTDEGLDASYAAHREAYVRTFDRLGLPYVIVAATSGAMGGSASEELTVDYEGQHIDIGFNSRYVLDVAGQIDGDLMELAIADGASPVVIRDTADAGALYVLMPMRV